MKKTSYGTNHKNVLQSPHMKISTIRAQEVLDSRGNPTVEATITLSSGQSASAMVPSGASAGSHEALELRDGDKKRYRGKGVLKAVSNVNTIIAPALKDMDPTQQMKIDQAMIDLDGTSGKTKLGANAILAVSMAVTKVAAQATNQPLYYYIATLFGNSTSQFTLPMPMMNVLNGGRHARGSTDMQEYLLIPVGAKSIAEAVRWGAEIFHQLADILKENGLSTNVGDEGGYAPPLLHNVEPLEFMVEAITQAGYKPGHEVAIGMDPAANEFYNHDKYELKTDGHRLSADEMVKLYARWIRDFPIVSIEDGLAEDDWDGFALQTRTMGEKIQIVGDDLFVTNIDRLQKGFDLSAANAILIKLNQIGTVTETMQTIQLAHQHNWQTIISHRSGETEDSFIADFAVGSGAGQIKTGSLCRSERIAKYNQLMRIEQSLGKKATLAEFPFKATN